MEFHFERLTVWQNAMRLVAQIYEATRRFPLQERFGLTSQLQRAAVSVTANIAEGKGRYHRQEFLQFLYLSRGSLYETISLIKIAASLKYLDSKIEMTLLSACQQTLSQLSGLINSLKIPRAQSPEPRTVLHPSPEP